LKFKAEFTLIFEGYAFLDLTLAITMVDLPTMLQIIGYLVIGGILFKPFGWGKDAFILLTIKQLIEIA
jgi:hypothetical protein